MIIICLARYSTRCVGASTMFVNVGRSSDIEVKSQQHLALANLRDLP